MTKSRAETIQEFRSTVNMSPKELSEYLETPESQSVGMHQDGDDEAVGHHSGRRIVELLQRQSDDEYDDGDIAHMRCPAEMCFYSPFIINNNAEGGLLYVHRHLAQRHHLKSTTDVEHSRWRYSLKNWGHDPLREED